METGTVIVGLGVLISLFGYLELIRRDLRSEIKEVRQASETAHKDIQTRLGKVETQVATLSERVNCVDDKVSDIQRRLGQGS